MQQLLPSSYAGWQNHPVCTMRYHFVVPAGSGPLSAADSASLPGMVERCHAAASAANGSGNSNGNCNAHAKPSQSAAIACNGHAAAAAAAAPAGEASPAGATAAGKPPTDGQLDAEGPPFQIALPAVETLESHDRSSGSQVRS